MNWLPLGTPSPDPGAGPAGAADATATPQSRVNDISATAIRAIVDFLISFTTCIIVRNYQK